MSVYSLTPVWKSSTASGNDLLVLLSLADMANDGDGFAFAKVVTVAAKARLSRGRCYDRLDSLIELGELRMFTRGHYRSPAYVITVVDTPLDTDGIIDRLTDLDPEAHWQERIPGQGELPFDTTERLSQTETIPAEQHDRTLESRSQDADQEIHPDRGRANEQKPNPEKIVPERDDPSRNATIGGEEIVAPARQDRRDSATTYEPSSNRLPTTTTTDGLTEAVAKRDDPGGGGASGDHGPWITPPRVLAREWCEITGKRFAGDLAVAYTRQVAHFLKDHPEPTHAFLRRAHAEGIKHPSGWAWLNGAAPRFNVELPDCDACGNHRLRGVLPNGTLVDYDDPLADALTPCPACRPSEDAAT